MKQAPWGAIMLRPRTACLVSTAGRPLLQVQKRRYGPAGDSNGPSTTARAQNNNRWTKDGKKPIFFSQADPEPDEVRPRDREPAHFYDFSRFRGYTRSQGEAAKHEAIREMMAMNMEDRRGNWLQMSTEALAEGCIGYLSEEDEEDWEHPEFHSGFTGASETYKAQVLRDQCYGRPAYEWQIPAEIPQLYGYRTIRSTVDLCSTPAAMSNTGFGWSGNADTLTRSGQTVKIVKMTELAAHVEAADTVVLQYSAEKHLDSFHKAWSPTNRLAATGCYLSTVWAAALLMQGDWAPVLSFPDTTVGAYFGYLAIGGINAMAYYNTFFLPENRTLKAVAAKCREHQKDIVFGDWIAEDVKERLSHNTDRDFVMELNKHYEDISRTDRVVQWTQDTLGTKKFPENPSDAPQTYEEAIQQKRIDVLAHTLNNCYGNNIVVGLQDAGCGSIPADKVSALLSKRLTGEIPMKIPLSWRDTRVEVVF